MGVKDFGSSEVVWRFWKSLYFYYSATIRIVTGIFLAKTPNQVKAKAQDRWRDSRKDSCELHNLIL
jgi:hypothetical protein